MERATLNAEEIATDWIDYWKEHYATGEFPDREMKVDCFDLPREMPALCWQSILAILERIEADPDNDLFQVLAAGLLEDLLVHHGPAVIAEVERQAGRDARFNLLLGGVWRNAMSEDIWARVEACRREVW